MKKLVFLISFCFAINANANILDIQQVDLEKISKMADDICGNISLKGKAEKVVIDIKEGLSQNQIDKIKEKLNDYYEEIIVEKNKITLKNKALSQSELKNALLHSMDCKREVIKIYMEEELLKGR